MKTILEHKIPALLKASGNWLAFLPMVLVLVQFSVVLMVYVFATGSIQLQETLQYINAMMFMGGAGYTAIKDEHVRVDIFYGRATKKTKAKVNFFGTLFLLIPFLALFWYSSIPYVLNSWEIWEGSVETSGLPFIYILKSTLLLFATTMTLFAISELYQCVKTLKERN